MTGIQTFKTLLKQISVEKKKDNPKTKHCKSSKKKDAIIDVWAVFASPAPMSHLHRRNIITRQPLQIIVLLSTLQSRTATLMY